MRRYWTKSAAAAAGTVLVTSLAAVPAAAATPPSVTSLSVHEGAIAGGTTLTVHGKNFTNARSVEFGTTKATKVTHPNATTLVVVAPRHAAGKVDVRVVTSHGTSAKRSADTFTYWAPPRVTAVTPAKGGEGTRVTITGSSLHAVTAVVFGSVKGTKLVSSSPTRLQVTAPSHAAGKVTLHVTTRYGTSATASFTFAQLHASALPLPPGITDPYASFEGMSCPTGRWCAFAGTYTDSHSLSQGMLDIRSNGNWTSQTAPVPNGYTTVMLRDVSCVSSARCYAIGTAFNASTQLAVLEGWDGHAWKVISVPVPGDYESNGSLVHISCASSGVCAATGNYFKARPGGGSTAVASLYTITSTAITASAVPAPSGEGANTPTVNAVACASAGSCVAVGEWWDADNRTHPLVLTNGTSGWNEHFGPVPTSHPYGELDSVECSHGCHAAGIVSDASGNSQNSVLDTLGATDTQSVIANDTTLISTAACASSTTCAAFFAKKTGSATGSYLAYLTGGRWHAAAAPLVSGSTYFSVNAITCPTGACVAAGYWYVSGHPEATFGIATYTDGAWVPTTAPAVTGVTAYGVIGISCPTAGACIVATDKTLLTQS